MRSSEYIDGVRIFGSSSPSSRSSRHRAADGSRPSPPTDVSADRDRTDEAATSPDTDQDVASSEAVQAHADVVTGDEPGGDEPRGEEPGGDEQDRAGVEGDSIESIVAELATGVTDPEERRILDELAREMGAPGARLDVDDDERSR